MFKTVAPFYKGIGYVVYAFKAKGIFPVSAVGYRCLFNPIPRILREKPIQFFHFMALFPFEMIFKLYIMK